MKKPIWFAILALALSLEARSAPVEFSRARIGEVLQGAQPSVALERDHGFVVTWQSTDKEIMTLNWLALDFDGQPTGKGVIAEGSNWFVNWADTPALTVLDNGDWVAFWLERNDPSAAEGYDIQLVRSIDRGKSWSKPISPHRDGTKTQHGFVSLVADGDDRVLLAWLDGRRAEIMTNDNAAHIAHDHESAPMALRSVVINREGALFSELEIDDRTCSCCQTDMTRWSTQSVLVYRDRSETEVRDISIARRASDTWQVPTTVHDDRWQIEGCPVNGPAIAVNGEHGLVYWPTMVDEQLRLRYVLADSPAAFATKPQMRELPLPTMPSGRVDAIPWHDGFLLTWISRARDRPAVEIAFVDRTGRLELSRPIAEPALRGRSTGFPRAASNGKVGLVVWPELSGDGRPVIGAALIR